MSDAGGRDGGGSRMPARPVDRRQRPWNKGLLVGQKKPLEPKHVWSIRVRLEIARSVRDLAIFNLAIDSKLRACDLVKLRLDDRAPAPDTCTYSRRLIQTTFVRRFSCWLMKTLEKLSHQIRLEVPRLSTSPAPFLPTIFPLSATTRPRAMVVTGQPVTSNPSQGV
jgi:hypothetical protein